MRCIVVGFGIQGKKRVLSLGADCVGILEPDGPIFGTNSWSKIEYAPLDLYDAAMVCVPPDQKPDIVEYLAANKKHMLIEKPLLESNGWKIDLFDRACKENGVVAYVAYNHRFEPMIVKLKEIIDSGDLGKLYHCRMFYGNGTAEDVRKSPWRDSGYGVMAEIGTHLIDLASMLFGVPFSFEMVSAAKHENKLMDHAIFRAQRDSTSPISVECEVTYLSWKNTFTIDLIGENGSAHLDGLTKWRSSSLTVRKRKRPPGVPTEKIYIEAHEDETWALEYDHFKSLCEKGEHPGLARDRMINKTLEAL